MSSKRLALVLFVVAAPVARADPPPDGARLLAEARSLLLSGYVDEHLSKDVLDVAAVAGMMRALNGGKDGPNQLLTPAEMKDLSADLKGELVGIGVRIDFDADSGMARVLAASPGSPAASADLRPTDRILSVDGQSFRGRTVADMVHAIRGAEGQPLRLAVLRGSTVTEKTIVRRAIAWPSVDHARFGDLGVVTVHGFNERTPEQLEAALAAVEGASLAGLVIDLRDNPGGLFEKALASAELLVPKGAEIVRTVDRGGVPKRYFSARSPVLRGPPIAVLVDGQTASSAEILAEALRVGAGATLVGSKTYGKWRMEILRDLPSGYALKFTVALIQSPRGISFDGKGLVPDFEVAAGSEPLDEARRHPELSQRMEVDPQLKAAVQLLRLRH